MLFNSLHKCASRMAKDLSGEIRRQIIALRNEGYSQRQIAAKIGVSKGSLCTAVTLNEARERTSFSWMHNPCSGHIDSSQIWGQASDWTVLYLNNL